MSATDASGAAVAPVAGIAVPGESLGTEGTGHGAAEAGLPEAGTPAYYEAIARKQGWKPKEEYTGDEVNPDDWVDATSYVTRKPLIDKISKQNKQLKELERTVAAMAKHYNTSVEQAKVRAIAELKEQRRDAIQIGDAVKVDELDTQIEQVKQMEEPVKPTVDSAVVDFVSEHKAWFNVDKEMTTFAVSFNEAYLKEHPGDMEKSLAETLKAVKRAYPEKFTNSRKENPPAVDSGGAPPAGGSKYTMNRLNHEQKLVYEQLVKRHGQMTHDEYFKGLEEAGFLEK